MALPDPATSTGQALIRVGVIDHEGIVQPATAEPPALPPGEADTPPPDSASGLIEFELPSGIKVRADAGIGEAALRRALLAAKGLVA